LAWKPTQFIKENYETRIDRWKEASKESPHAAFLLAECYWLQGKMIFPSVLELLVFAEQKGLAEAQIRLAEIFLWGFGVSSENEMIAWARLQPLLTDYETKVITIFIEQQIIYKQSLKIYKNFADSGYYDGMTQIEVEEEILTTLNFDYYKSGRKLLAGIEKPKQVVPQPDGGLLCNWRASCCPAQRGFTIIFDKNGKAVILHKNFPQ
jgi:TPR repeat protein